MGRDKAGLSLRGRSLLERAVDRVRQAGGEPLILGPPRAEFETAGCRQIDESVVRSTEPGGALFALRHGLSVCGTPVAVALACDVPLVPPDFLRFLASEAEGYEAVVPRVAGELQVLTAGYARSCLEAIDRHLASGAGSVHGFLPAVRLRLVEVEEIERFGGEAIFLNVNRPEDLARAEAWLARGGG